MGRDHKKPLNGETDDWVFSSGISLGALLKREREKKGLSYTQISQQTRLRPHFLEAIENEDWEHLPAPTLVKGFIRSYARVLGLDPERLLDLYREETGDGDFSQEFVITTPAQKKKWPFWVFGLVILLAAAAGFYAWLTFFPAEKETNVPENAGVQQLADDKMPQLPDKQRKTETAEVKNDDKPNIADSELRANGQGESRDVPAEPKEPPKESAKPAVSLEVAQEKSETEIPKETVETGSLKLHLKGFVNERTWLRISIDGLKPKEYVFAPSDTPEWKARKGFELLIGNAGGIALEFNGKKMDNLGKRGQVVRIKLPEERERSSSEN